VELFSETNFDLDTIDDLGKEMEVDNEIKREEDEGRKERRSEREKRERDRDPRRDRSRALNTHGPITLLILFFVLSTARRRSDTYDEDRRGDVGVILVINTCSSAHIFLFSSFLFLGLNPLSRTYLSLFRDALPAVALGLGAGLGLGGARPLPGGGVEDTVVRVRAPGRARARDLVEVTRVAVVATYRSLGRSEAQ